MFDDEIPYGNAEVGEVGCEEGVEEVAVHDLRESGPDCSKFAATF